MTTTTTTRKPANLNHIIKRVESRGEYMTRRYYYTNRDMCDRREIVRIERDALGTTRTLDRDSWQIVAVIR